MSRIAKFISGVVISSVLLFTIASAKIPPSHISEPQVTQTYISEYTKEDIYQLKEFHKIVLRQRLINLNSDGTVSINKKAYIIAKDKNTFQKYLQSVNEINDIIKLGIVSVNKNFEFKALPRDEITKTIYNRDKELQQNGILSDNKFDPQQHINYSFTSSLSANPLTSAMLTLTSSSSTLPTLYAFDTACQNHETLAALYNSLSAFMFPPTAYSTTVGWWVSKVREGGAWDYKSVSGYKPWNKKWNAVQRWTTSVKTSEWFGNYNYGFTGHYLFSLNILLAGGDGVSLVIHHALDDPEDKAAVKQGYNEYA